MMATLPLLTTWTVVLVACSDLPWWVVFVALVLEEEYGR